MSSADDELLSRAKQGDGDSLAALLRSHGPAVRGRLGIGSRWQAQLDAADVMQVTYLEAFLRIKELSANTVGSFVAWLEQIAQNNLRDAIRELTRARRPDPTCQIRGRDRDESISTLLATLADDTRTASSICATQEAVSLLEKALKHLPEDYRQVVELFDLEGRPAEEVARVMGRSRGGIYVLRVRAHGRLRGLLGSTTHFFGTS
jgi:RNA polymerase sigma-70 factor (ECF subfamily)